jgi:hypothetical protein
LQWADCGQSEGISHNKRGDTTAGPEGIARMAGDMEGIRGKENPRPGAYSNFVSTPAGGVPMILILLVGAAIILLDSALE